jgi:hypothetical protein
MTNEEFLAYLNSLPPEVREQVAQSTKMLSEYAAKASFVRERIQRNFPNMPPKLRAVLSLAIARVL